MKCPKCGINLLEHVQTCPFCKTPISNNVAQEGNRTPVGENTGRFSTVDPTRDSYDFDLQYTLTFRDSGEIKQAIADMDAGFDSSLSSERKSSSKKDGVVSRYSLEEMQEAALRAQQRRERRNGAKTSSGDNLKAKRRVTSTERRKASALRAAKEKRRTSNGVPSIPKSKRGLLAGTAVLALVVVLIIGIVNICAFFAHNDPEYPTVYAKGNELYSYYGGKEELLSSNFITQAYDAERDTTSHTSSDPKIKFDKTLSEKNFVTISESGTVTYFMENVNMNTRAGNLVYYENGRKKSRTVLAQNVYYNILLGRDGSSVMYLKNSDENGYHGELCYWKPGMKEPKTIENDINTGNFIFSQDCTSVTYIRNFNPEIYSGDLCYLSLADNVASSKRVDDRVSFVFGTTPKSKTYFYAKDYDKKTGTYDLYVQSDLEGPKMLAEKGYLAPVISNKTEKVFVYSNYNKNFQTLSCIDLATGVNTELAKEMTKIIKIRIDDGAVIYSKAYETEKADYYFVNTTSPNPQTVATAINLKASSTPGVVTFDASDDFSKIAYIGGYDTTKMRGALYTMSILNDYAGSEMRISDDAFSCDVSADAAVVRFATSFNRDQNTVNLVSYSNSNTLSLADGVAVGAFTFDKMGEYAIYAKEVDAELQSGIIQSVNKKARIKELGEAVSAYGLKKDGTVLLLKNSEEEGSVLYKTGLKGGKIKHIADGVTKVVLY